MAARGIASRCDAASQTDANYSTDAEGTVTCTLAEAERLWARKHQQLLQEFEVMMASQAEFYEQQFDNVSAGVFRRA